MSNLPPELYCLLCERVMKDAVFSKCCFQSFCENCIRDQVISKSNCVCGAKGRPENDFVPNNAVRDTIKRILETNYSGACNHDHGKQFALPTALKGIKVPMQNVEATMIQGSKKEEEPLISEQKISVITEEPALQGSACAIPADREVQHKEVTVDAGKEFAVPAASVGGQAPLQNVEATNIQEDRNLEESLISQPGVSDTTKEPLLQESAPPVDKELQRKEFANIGERKLEDESSIFRPEASGITKESASQGSALETDKVQSKKVTKIQDSNLEEESPIVQPEASGIIKEQALQGSALSANNAQRKEVTVYMEKKKSKKKSNLPINAGEIQWTAQQYHAAQSYMQSIYPFSYNPYLNSMYPGMEAYMKQCGIIPPHMEYNIIPSNVPLGVPGMTSSQISPHSRESSKDRECNREIRKSVDATSVKLKRASNMILTPPPPSSKVQRDINQPRREQRHNERKGQSPQWTSSMTASKRKSSRHIDDHKEYDDSYHHKHHKELRHHHGTPSVARRSVIHEHDSSDDKERHFKRRRSRY
uniref:uncharacterized protein LOC122585216 n=1 Tax=Erigeron canadensis TaxID=72917 RepID=UPI001CB8CC0C|nr:uncharacterized protein LOC122585216 [Erigeron canadensis]